MPPNTGFTRVPEARLEWQDPILLDDVGAAFPDLKLWLAHGVTTVRGVPFADFDLTVSEKQRSARNEIVAP